MMTSLLAKRLLKNAPKQQARRKLLRQTRDRVPWSGLRTGSKSVFRQPPRSGLPLTVLALSLAAQGCNSAPGAPKNGVEVPRPDAVLDFKTLYQQNCSACHGENGVNGPSYPLANPEYQALVDEDTLRKVISQGEPGTLMPVFVTSAGGTLTSEQVDALVKGIRNAWWKQGTVTVSGAPAYRAAGAGNPAQGQKVYNANCASCHSPTGKAGSITNPDFLALLSDQALRTIIIAGRPDIGQPDWRGEVPGHSPGHSQMTDQDVTDVVSWLSSQRRNAGQGTPSARLKQPQLTASTGGESE